ncbi:MAG TPA: rhodanese-like domain-containing protein [Candidatus Egerieenecus merdigallinarum]|nr:rhodanese-like domain-containing protein [Candidatus Egerieenecus merdigallinarum]
MNLEKIAIPVLLVLALVLTGVTNFAPKTTGYRQVTTEEAVNIMQTEENYVILDVRTAQEFASGHIPGAALLPNETIGTEDIPLLPDKDQLILVYCRSGNRSKQAAEKLAQLGYTNIVEFGGINSWTGKIVTE